MTDILAIFGVAALFVLMGLFYRHRSCPNAKEDGSCVDGCTSSITRCPVKNTSESKHANP